MIILITAIFAFVLAFTLGFALGFFKKVFAVEQDPLAEQVRECLPGANCGACGFPGCDGYASAIVAKKAGIDKCSVGGQPVADKLAALVGGGAKMTPEVAVLACQGSAECAPLKGEYTGLETCRGAQISLSGIKLCAWGCIGFGDCVKVCKFGALSMGAQGLPVIDREKCTGCKVCVAECPKGIIRAVPKDAKGAIALCSNRNTIKSQVMKTCKVGCIKCGICVKVCPNDCIVLEDGIPKVDYAKCSSCGMCITKCPRKVIQAQPL
ncbi:MAG: RnfABCDGE type electron transport complex subunit B [Treponema sp.]|jgi:Na+-translocating ferredoxin:NAD+ oxidoreductase RNF subunit RnfB|nr:RnfABCDGE type electron transport complex subunit B [Treponema sp.]